ncbi:uncharacterized protein LOC123466286 isoform X2 [Daphnia magna]|nr:uncharacterized protein LOC123466286 isoform X2 [Daphnia magna]
MTRKPCFVFNCKSSYNKEKESLAFFHPPKLCLNSWQEIIKKPGLTCQSRICSIHFEENDILKGREIQGVFYSYPKWKLKSGARPSKLLGNDVSVLERPAAKKYVHSDRFKSPYRNITAKSKAANPKLQLDNQSFLSNNNTNVLIPSHAKKSTSNSIAIHQLDAEKGKVNDMEAAEPVALPCVTTEDMFQEPTTETLLHIPPEKEMASESESQLRVEFEPNDMEVDELIGAPGEMTEEMLQENSEQTARETEMEGYLDPATYTDVIARVKLPSSSWMWQEDKVNKTLVCFSHSFSPDRKIVIKTISVVSMNKVELFLNGKQIFPRNVKTNFNVIEDLSNIIGAVEVSNVCDGIVELSLANVCVTSRCSAVKDGKIIRSNRCTGLTENNVCLNCKFLKKYLMTRKKQLGCKAERTGIQKKNQQQKRNLAMRRILQQGKLVSGIVSNLEKEKQTLTITNQKLIKEQKKNNFDEKLKCLSPTRYHSLFQPSHL